MSLTNCERLLDHASMADVAELAEQVREHFRGLAVLIQGFKTTTEHAVSVAPMPVSPRASARGEAFRRAA
ncbi:MAG: hypothetical protein ACFCUJ_03975 [Thiotrichales bacterium]